MRGFYCFPLVMLLFMSSLAQSSTASAQVRRFVAVKALVNSMDDPDKAAEQEPQPKTQADKDETITWSTTSSTFSHFTAEVIGLVWVVVLGSTPLFIWKSDERAVTTTGVVLSVLMWMALFGGLFLFTNVILFQSPHFEEIRSLTIIECTYFMTQVITTVGYGDVTPAKHRGQLFVGVYVVLSFFVIALLVSEMQSIVVSRVQKYKTLLEKHTGIHVPNETGSSKSIGLGEVQFKPEKPSPINLILTLLMFALIACVWIVFFHYYPGENKPWVDACYMALITLTTVGFGAVTPVTEGGMLFGAFFMFLGTGALVTVVAEFSSYMLEMAAWEAWDPRKFHDDLIELRDSLHKGELPDSPSTPGEDGRGLLSELDFMTFTLVHKGIITKHQVDSIKQAYTAMQPNKKGRVTIASIESLAGIDSAKLDLLEKGGGPQ